MSRLICFLAMLGGLLLVTAVPALAQGDSPIASYSGELLPVALMVCFPLGLLLLFSSALPESKAPAAAIGLLLAWAAAALAYFAVGFAFQFGGIAQASPNPALAGLYWEWYPVDPAIELAEARLWGCWRCKAGHSLARPSPRRCCCCFSATPGWRARRP